MLHVGGRAAAMLLLVATPLAAQRSGRRVLDREFIAAAGWHRMGEIASALPPGSTASIDGFNHELRGSRLGFFRTTQVSATWLVRLDGQPVPMHVGGMWILDDVPVAITQLDSVVITEGPRLTDGRVALLGTIDLYTRRPRGLSLVGDYQHGDETGDPGPYRYTSRSSPNIEKLGPFASGAAAAGSSLAAVDLAARYASLNITDERIVQRIGPTFGQYQSDVNASGGSGVATLDVLGGRTWVIAGRGRFTGFLPLATDATNQQARVIASHGGLSGEAALVGRTWRYAASASKLEIGTIGASSLGLAEQDRRYLDGFMETEIVAGLRVGLGVTEARQETPTDVRQQPSARAWMSYAGPAMLDLAVNHSAGRPRYSGSAQVERAVSDSDRVRVSLTRLEAWRFGDLAWMDQPVADSGGTTANDARVELTTRMLAGMQPTWYARAFSYTDIGASDVRGLAAGVAAATPVSSTTSVRLRAEITQLVGDGDVGEASTPGGYVDGAVATRAPGGFRVALAGRYSPSTHWTGFADDVPATRRIDFSVNKALWRERIRAQLVVRNLLNGAERTHPDGAQWNLRTHLAVTITLPSKPGADESRGAPAADVGDRRFGAGHVVQRAPVPRGDLSHARDRARP